MANGTISDLAVVILAAGQGKRMKSKRAKVLHPVAGMPMIRYVVKTAASLGAQRILVVVGHQAEKVKQELADCACEFVLQEELRGTGDAV